MKAESVYTGNKMTGYSLLGYGPTSQARSTIRAGRENRGRPFRPQPTVFLAGEEWVEGLRLLAEAGTEACR